MRVPVIVRVDPATRAFTLVVGKPAVAALLLKEAGKEKGSGKSKTDVVGDVSLESVQRIAEAKGIGSVGRGLEEQMNQVIGTCVSMGLTVDGQDPRALLKERHRGAGRPMMGGPSRPSPAGPFERRARRTSPSSRGARGQAEAQGRLDDRGEAEIMNILRAGNDPSTGSPPTLSSPPRWSGSWTTRRSSARSQAPVRRTRSHCRASPERDDRPPGDPCDAPRRVPAGDSRAGYLSAGFLFLVLGWGVGIVPTSWSTRSPRAAGNRSARSGSSPPGGSGVRGRDLRFLHGIARRRDDVDRLVDAGRGPRASGHGSNGPSTAPRPSGRREGRRRGTLSAASGAGCTPRTSVRPRPGSSGSTSDRRTCTGGTPAARTLRNCRRA